MCGICGVVGRADREVLLHMRDALTHRGPDESGDYSAAPVHLAHRRLSIIDLNTGQQPLLSADGSIVLVFNGEIYNYTTLRTELEGDGFEFQTRSDTESIIHAYRKYGDRCPEYLDGMFAFVLYDREKNRLFGARDRFGKKPFYYSLPAGENGREFAFASEVRALLANPAVKQAARLATDSILSYLLHDYIPGARTAFDNVFRLPAGHAFSLDIADPIPARLTSWAYWQNPIVREPNLDVSEAEAIDAIDSLLDAAVQRRLMSDVPLGVFLSGGIDSSAIVAVLTRHLSPAEIQTFSIGFDDPSFDESAYAALAASYYGTRHSNRQFSAADCLAELDVCLRHLDEPFADPSILPTSLLSRFARESVTVALGGDGGDELFAGYDPFKAIRPAKTYDALVPTWLHRAAVKGCRKLLKSDGKNMSLAFRVERFLRGAKSPESERMTTWLGAFDATGAAQLLADRSEQQLRKTLFEPERALFVGIENASEDPIRAGLCYFQSFYLIDDILLKADRASMMHSLELRSPFLDTALAEYVNRLPSNYKYRNGRTKYLLKRLLSRTQNGRQLVPDALLRRPKKGFGIPVSRWIRGELSGEFQTSLVAEWPDALGFLDKQRISALLSEHIAGVRDHGKELWALFMLSGWVKNWVD